jgi:hypothetical protein
LYYYFFIFLSSFFFKNILVYVPVLCYNGLVY